MDFLNEFLCEMNNLMNRIAFWRLATPLKPTIHFKLVNDYRDERCCFWNKIVGSSIHMMANGFPSR